MLVSFEICHTGNSIVAKKASRFVCHVTHAHVLSKLLVQLFPKLAESLPPARFIRDPSARPRSERPAIVLRVPPRSALSNLANAPPFRSDLRAIFHWLPNRASDRAERLLSAKDARLPDKGTRLFDATNERANCAA